MHHVVLENWSRGHSSLHARDPRAKVLALLVFLVVAGTTPAGLSTVFVSYFLFLGAGILIARLPVWSLLARAALVLPFSLTFAAITFLGGDAPRALTLIWKSYLSVLGVLLLMGTTPLPSLMAGLRSLGAPAFLTLVIQFVHRYLFVISEQAQHMRLAAACRGSLLRGASTRGHFKAAAGAVAVLFARSYSRAEGIHRAMLARGFRGNLPLVDQLRFRWSDAAFLIIAATLPLVLRAAAASWS